MHDRQAYSLNNHYCTRSLHVSPVSYLKIPISPHSNCSLEDPSHASALAGPIIGACPTGYSSGDFPDPRSPTTLLRPRNPFKLGTFNVRTLQRIGQQASLARTLESLGVDICCLQETRLPDPSCVTHLVSPADDKKVFYLRLSNDPELSTSGQAGVGIALSGRAEQALLEWIPVNNRICAIRLNGSCRVSGSKDVYRCLYIVCAYAPTDCSSDDDKDDFYSKLDTLLRRAPKSDIVILAGDLNAKVGRLTATESHLGGAFGIESLRSDNGDRLLNLCSDHRLYLTSTSFRHRSRRSATWRPPCANQAWTQIDHIAVTYRWRGCVQDCRSYWNTSVDSDHALVCAKISLRFGGKKKTTTQKVDYSKLLLPTIQTIYQRKLLSLLPPTMERPLDDLWSSIRDAMYTAGIECCGTIQRSKPRWISPRSLQLIDTHRSLSPTHANDPARRTLKARLYDSLKNDREKWWSERVVEIEEAALSGNQRKLFQLIRATGIRQPGLSETICEEDGSYIKNLQRRMERWAEHFSAQFNWPPATQHLGNQVLSAPWNVPSDPPDKEEIRKELTYLRRNKAAGLDDLSPALFKDGGETIAETLQGLFCKIWQEESVPASWNESVICPVSKKAPRNVCDNYRGISLIPVAAKIFASILLHRLSTAPELRMREEQAGFRSGRGCIDQIFTLRQILEHRHTYHRPTVTVFLDIRAAFDSIDRVALWNCLHRIGVPWKYVQLIKAMYLHTAGRVKAYGKLSQSFTVSSGVRQGCPLSPFLFNIAIDDIMQKALIGLRNDGVELLPGGRVFDLEYADDIVLVANSSQDMQRALDRLAIEVVRYGLRFAPSKCKILLQDWQGVAPVITLCGDTLEAVEHFTYLGSRISTAGKIEEEIKARISKARTAFASLRHLWRRHDIRLALKGRVYCAVVRSVLLYGCETWPLRVADMRQLCVFEHRCLRNIARVRWQRHVTNQAVREKVLGANCSLSEVILLRQLRWLGHVLRMPDVRLPHRTLFATAGVNWKKDRGGQEITWRSRMKKATAKLAKVGRIRLPGWGPKDSECLWLDTLKDMAQNRDQWRACALSCSTYIPPTP